MKKHIIIKCPVCKGKTQSPMTVSTTKVGSKRKLDKIQIGIRHCRKCNLLIPMDNAIAFWDGNKSIRAHWNITIIKVKRRHHTIGMFVLEA